MLFIMVPRLVIDILVCGVSFTLITFSCARITSMFMVNRSYRIFEFYIILLF